MDIQAVQAMRAEIEAHITERLQAFEENTKARVEHLHVKRRPGTDHADRDITQVYVDVEIGRVHEACDT